MSTKGHAALLDEEWDDFGDFPLVVYRQPNGDKVILDDMPPGWELDFDEDDAEE